MNTPKKKFDTPDDSKTQKANLDNESIANNRLSVDDEDDFDEPLDDLGGFEDLETFDDEDDF